MRTTVIRRGMLASLGLVAVVGMAACAATKAPNNATHTARPAASSTPTHAASPPSQTPSATPRAPRGVQNLVISSTERGELTAAFVAHYGISPSDVAGTYSGSVYYAYDPATDTYWAIAQFKASSTASLNVLVKFQDGGNFGLFRKVGTGSWQVQTADYPPACTEPQFFPATVLMAWGLPTSTPAPIPDGYHC